MATAELQSADHIVLYNVPWSTYETLLRDLGARGTKLTYYQGALEIMSPSLKHERAKCLVAMMIDVFRIECGIAVFRGGSTTFKQEMLEHGLEPDECYWVANEARMRGREDFDADRDPPPDLAIEVEITSNVLPRLSIYAKLGVPEVWRYDGRKLSVLSRTSESEYVERAASGVFPQLPVHEMVRFLDRRNDTDETSLMREFRDWVREIRSATG